MADKNIDDILGNPAEVHTEPADDTEGAEIEAAKDIESADTETDSPKNADTIDAHDESAEAVINADNTVNESSSDDLEPIEEDDKSDDPIASDINNDDEAVPELTTHYADTFIKVYVAPNDKARHHWARGTYYMYGDRVIGSFVPVICSVPGIGRVEGYIKHNGG